MLQDLSTLDGADSDPSESELASDNLRSALRAATKLPSLVAEAKFSSTFDRVIDEAIVAALTDPAAFPRGISDERCKQRKKALVPYIGKRLIGVMINLPGVQYTIEVDPWLQKVIHWECVPT